MRPLNPADRQLTIVSFYRFSTHQNDIANGPQSVRMIKVRFTRNPVRLSISLSNATIQALRQMTDHEGATFRQGAQ